MPTIFRDPVLVDSFEFNTKTRVDGALFNVDTLDGWDDSPEPTVVVGQFTYSDGVVTAERFPFKEKYMEVGGWIHTHSRQEAERAKTQIRAMFNPNREIFLVRRGPTPQGYRVRASTSVSFPTDIGREGFRFLVQVMADWPFRLGVEEKEYLARPFIGAGFYRLYSTPGMVTNLVKNGSFETDISGWVVTSGTLSSYNSGSSNWWPDHTSVARGVRDLLATSDGTAAYVTAVQAVDNAIPVTPGKWVAVHALIASDSLGTHAARGARVDVALYGTSPTTYMASGPYVQSTFYAGRRVMYAFQVPAGYSTGRIRIQGFSGNTGTMLASGQRLWADAVMAVEANTEAEALAGIATYFDGNTPDTPTVRYDWTGTPGASTSTKTYISLESGEPSSPKSRTYQYDPDKNTYYRTYYESIEGQGGDVIATVLRKNLINDPSAKSMWSASTTGLTYETSGGPINTPTWAKVTLTGDGTGSFRTLGQSSGTANFAVVEPGKEYAVRFQEIHSHMPLTRAGAYITWYDSAGVMLSQGVPAPAPGPAGQWNQMEQYFTAPANAAFARVGFSLGPDTDWPDGAYYGATEWLMEERATYDLYRTFFRGDFPGTTSIEYSYTGAIDNSPSILTQFTKVPEVNPLPDVITITNEGDAYAYPILEVTGPLPVGTWYIQNDTTGEILTFDSAINENQTLVIDNLDQTALIDNVPVDYYIRGTWIRLAPGLNQIRLVSGADAPGATLRIRAYDTWS